MLNRVCPSFLGASATPSAFSFNLSPKLGHIGHLSGNSDRLHLNKTLLCIDYPERQIPSRDTKESPAFNTLMNLTKGYEEWLKYQNINQSSAQKCINNAGSSFSSFSSCSIGILPRTMENERIGRQKLQTAWNAWKQWQVKYGYA